jgi:methylthioribose-1-phosphate isomerase
MRSIEWRDGGIEIIDQSLLPQRLEYLTLQDTDAVTAAIKTLRVRGAPALGIIGGFGVAQAAMRPPSANPKTVMERAEQAGKVLASTRPTAVNLAWGIERVLAKGRATPVTAGPLRIAQAMLDEALTIQREDEEACIAMAKNAIEFFPSKGVVLTHCNTGFLCTGGYGTALGAIRHAHESGHGLVVLATETRPLLQGARLTAWELSRLGIPHALVVDGAAPGLIARREVQIAVVGADRIAANGDVANKVGTYPIALAAATAKIPFVVVAPISSIDLSMSDGSKVEIEERPPAEVTSVLGHGVAPPGTQAINPAFDITPADLITAIVTERGIARAPYASSLKHIVGARASFARGKAKSAKARVAGTSSAKPARTHAAKPKRKPAAKKPAATPKKRVAAKRAAKTRSTAKPKPKAKTKSRGRR